MSRRLALAILALGAGGVVLASRAGAPQAAATGLTVVQTVRSQLDTPRHRVADLGGDGRAELLFVGADGKARVWRHVEGEALRLEPVPGEPTALARPAHSLLALKSLDGDDAEAP